MTKVEAQIQAYAITAKALEIEVIGMQVNDAVSGANGEGCTYHEDAYKNKAAELRSIAIKLHILARQLPEEKK